MLLLLTIALVLVGAVALVIGFVNDAMFPIYLSIACSLLAAVVLVVFSRLSKSRMEPATAGPVVAEEPARPPRERVGEEFPIADYEDRRVAEIVPLLSDLDNDELEMVREREADGRNRTTVIRRIDDLLDERRGVTAADEEDVDQGEDTLVSSAATFGRDDEDEDLEDEDLEDEEVVEDEDLFPIADYDDLTVDEILPVLDELTPDELEEVGDREAEGKNRDAILDRVDALLDEEEAAAPVKKTAKKKAPAKKAPARKTAASKKKAAAKKAPAKKTTAKKSTAKKTTAKKTTAKKTTAKKKAPAKKSPAKKSGAKKSTAKKSAAKRAAR